MPAVTYMVQCADGTLYTGWTNDLAARLEAHNRGLGAKYTRGRGPVTLVYAEEHPDKPSAQAREYAIKQLPRAEKIALSSRWLTAGNGCLAVSGGKDDGQA